MATEVHDRLGEAFCYVLHQELCTVVVLVHKRVKDE